jgi:hypothetical protein
MVNGARRINQIRQDCDETAEKRRRKTILFEGVFVGLSSLFVRQTHW